MGGCRQCLDILIKRFRSGAPGAEETMRKLAELAVAKTVLFVYVNQEGFERYKPTSFRQLVEGFLEYKDPLKVAGGAFLDSCEERAYNHPFVIAVFG